MLDDQRCLTTLEPRLDLSMLLLTLVTTASRLSVSGRGTAADSFLVVNGAGVVGEAAEDGSMAGLEGEAGEVRGQRRHGSIGGYPAAQGCAEGRNPRRHRREGRGAVAVAFEVDAGALETVSASNFLENVSGM